MATRLSRQRAREEFDQFVTATAADLLRTAYLVVWDAPAAEDLVQECLIRVARHWPRVRTMDYPVAYARRILVNLALGGARRRSRQLAELGGDGDLFIATRPDESAERALGAVDGASELVAALRTLAPLQRAVLGLRYFDDLSEAQIAEVLGCSAGTVKSTSSRAIDRLRQVLLAAEPDCIPSERLVTKGDHRHV
jgi:RNA polymerase sigma-70 factor (sigma-E family)